MWQCGQLGRDVAAAAAAATARAGCSALIRSYQDEEEARNYRPAALCHTALKAYTQTYRTLQHACGHVPCNS